MRWRGRDGGTRGDDNQTMHFSCNSWLDVNKYVAWSIILLVLGYFSGGKEPNTAPDKSLPPPRTCQWCSHDMQITLKQVYPFFLGTMVVFLVLGSLGPACIYVGGTRNHFETYTSSVVNYNKNKYNYVDCVKWVCNIILLEMDAYYYVMLT